MLEVRARLPCLVLPPVPLLQEMRPREGADHSRWRHHSLGKIQPQWELVGTGAWSSPQSKVLNESLPEGHWSKRASFAEDTHAAGVPQGNRDARHNREQRGLAAFPRFTPQCL